MYFDTKNYLKNNRNHTAKHTLKGLLDPRHDRYHFPILFLGVYSREREREKKEEEEGFGVKCHWERQSHRLIRRCELKIISFIKSRKSEGYPSKFISRC